MAQTTTVDGGREFSPSGMRRQAVALAAAVALGIGIGLAVSRSPAEAPTVDASGSGVIAPAIGIDWADFGTRHLTGFSGEAVDVTWSEDFTTRRYQPQG